VDAWGLTDVLVGASYGFLALALGVLVMRSSPKTPPNQSLSLYLLFVGVTWTLGLDSLLGAPFNLRISYNQVLLTVGSNFANSIIYANFFLQALPLRVLALFRTRPARLAMPVLAAGAVAFPFLRPDTCISGPAPLGPDGYDWSTVLVGYCANSALTYTIVITNGTATVLAIIALATSARGTQLRRRMGAYVTAFCVLDAVLVTYNTLPFNSSTGPTRVTFDLGLLLSMLLLARALLRFQLFDFDLRVKWTLKRGTLVAIILGAFFIVTALAEQYLQQFGWVVGGIAVGALLFALRPIERAIDRLADRAMPRTTGTPEYLAQRKHEIYRAAIEDAMRDGSVSAKERALLLRLADNLGLSAEESTRIERDLLAVPP
jgi:hypothetical protein